MGLINYITKESRLTVVQKPQKERLPCGVLGDVRGTLENLFVLYSKWAEFL